MNKIKVAIIGLGRIASLLEEDPLREKPCTHAGAVAANPDCELVAGCDINEERRNLFAKERDVPVYENAREMLCAHKPRIVSVATHPDSHYFYCRLSAKEGVPVIICEKPLADSLCKARKIAELEKTGATIIVNHERRYSRDYILAKAVLDGERLGKLLSVRAALYMGKTRRLTDVFWHDGTHLADAIMFLTNSNLLHKRRWGAKLNSSEGTAWLEGSIEKNKNKIPVIIELGAGRDHLVFEIEFSFERGRLRIGNGVFEIYESAPSPYARDFRSLKNTGEIFDGATGYFANMLKDAVDCAREPERKPVSGVMDALRVIEYLHKVKVWK